MLCNLTETSPVKEGMAIEAAAEMQRETAPVLKDIKAIAFDVQSTCVDFYQPLLRVGNKINSLKGLTLNWAVLSSEWRDLYRVALDDVIAARRPWIRVDHIYREALDILFDRHGLSDIFTQVERDDLNAVWTKLDPWPDSVEGLARLRAVSSHRRFRTPGMAADARNLYRPTHALQCLDVLSYALLARLYTCL